MLLKFLSTFGQYFITIAPGLACGFFLSGLIHELIPDIWIRQNLGQKGIKPILYATISGAVLPLCAWAELPLAISFYKKGVRLGPVLAFLLTAPTTSIITLIITYQILGLKFCLFTFFAVILMGLVIGLVGEVIAGNSKKEIVPSVNIGQKRFSELLFSLIKFRAHQKKIRQRLYLAMKFAFVDLLKEIGPGIVLGIMLAAIVSTLAPLNIWIKQNLSGLFGYIFALVFGLIMDITSVAAVPLTDAFIKQGLNIGAGMVLLLASPVTSYGVILVLRREFGIKVVLIYLGLIGSLSLILGYIFSLL